MKDKAADRIEHDLLGSREIPADALWGIHRRRADDNFDLAGRSSNVLMFHALGVVKAACIRVHKERLGADRAKAMETAAIEVMEGRHDSELSCDALQGGAGTSMNMLVNELIANRAAVLMGGKPGDHNLCHPHDHVNLEQSTNDVYPTALRVAAIFSCRRLEAGIITLQESFQNKEREFADLVCLGRTEMQDAVLMTMGRRFGSYADAIGRDRWRISKCEERLRTVNLGGTAIGTGIGASRKFIFGAVEELRALTGMNLARAENLIDATANCDVLVEVSGLLDALAANLIKISDDLRLLSSGPQGGLGEIKLPQLQEGSSIMPGKVNPVIPESIIQAGLMVMGNHSIITQACARGSLEINPFLPLVADRLLDSIGILERACRSLALRCVDQLTADRDVCARHAQSVTAQATALSSRIGHEKAGDLAKSAIEKNVSLRELALKEGISDFDEIVSAENVLRLGHHP